MADPRNNNAGDDLMEKLVAVNRVAKVVKGGRQFGGPDRIGLGESVQDDAMAFRRKHGRRG